MSDASVVEWMGMTVGPIKLIDFKRTEYFLMTFSPHELLRSDTLHVAKERIEY
jgi:hypothetical protein